MLLVVLVILLQFRSQKRRADFDRLEPDYWVVFPSAPSATVSGLGKYGPLHPEDFPRRGRRRPVQTVQTVSRRFWSAY